MTPLPPPQSSRKFATVKGTHSGVAIRPDGWLNQFVCVKCAMKDLDNVYFEGYEKLYRHLEEHVKRNMGVPRALFADAANAMIWEREGRRILRDRDTTAWLTRKFFDPFKVRDLVLRVGSVVTPPVTDDEGSWHPPRSLLLSTVESIPGLPDGFRLGFAPVVHEMAECDPYEYLDGSEDEE